MVTFEPTIHGYNNSWDDLDFNLMGDILTVCLHSHSPDHCHLLALQLLPLSHSNDTTTVAMPIKFTVVGTVSSVELSCRAIVLDIAQKVLGSTPQSHLAFFAHLGCVQRGPTWVTHLPIPNSVMTFTGDLLGVDGDMALLDIDSITYIPHPRRLPLTAVPLHYYWRMLSCSTE